MDNAPAMTQKAKGLDDVEEAFHGGTFGPEHVAVIRPLAQAFNPRIRIRASPSRAHFAIPMGGGKAFSNERNPMIDPDLEGPRHPVGPDAHIFHDLVPTSRSRYAPQEGDRPSRRRARVRHEAEPSEAQGA
jgi:hypothetical protein